MSIANGTENSILNLIFSATAWTNVASGNATGVSSPITNISVSLNTADPGDAGNMSTSETNYTNYARVNVARSTGWTSATTGSVNPAATISFAAGGVTSGGTVTNFCVGNPNNTDIFWTGTVTPSIVTGNGVTPQLTTSTSIALD